MSELENNSKKTDKRIDASDININASNKINQMNNQPYKDVYDYSILKNFLSCLILIYLAKSSFRIILYNK
jgi:hypothetical protein